MAQVNKQNLGFLGESFQYRLTHEFLENHTFFEDLSAILDQNMFTDPNLKVVVGMMKNYYEKEGRAPSYDTLEIELRSLAHSERELETYIAILKKIKAMPSDGVDRIKDLAEKFFRQQNIIRTANEILKIAGDGDMSKYDTCVGLLNDAMAKGTHNDFGETVFDHLNETLSDDYRVPIPTGIGKIDEALEGGLGKGELGVIIGSSGFGKALWVNENVVTPTGYRKMGDLKVGDYVLDRQGKPTKVLGVFPQGKRDLYRVTMSDGVSCVCDMEHLWPAKTKDGTEQVLTLREMADKGLRDEDGCFRFETPIAEPVEFEGSPVAINPYFLGVMLGKMESEQENDAWLRLDGKERGDCLNITIGDNDDASIPQEYLVNSADVRTKLLNGLLDANGKYLGGNCYSYKTKFQQLSLDIKYLVRSMGGMAWSYMFRDGTIHLILTLCNPKVRQSGFNLTKEKLVGKSTFRRYVAMVEYECTDDAICILVDNDEHLFLTNDFIVTHNTSLTTSMAGYAACQGFKVLQIVFEDRIKQIQRKHIGRITGIEAKDLSKPDKVDIVKQLIETFPDKETLAKNLRIVRFPSGEKTAAQIERFIKRLINSGFKPDMVIVDYFECLNHEADKSITNEFEKEGKTMRRFEAMAGELDMAFWIPSQGTKDSFNLELVTMDKIGGSVKKAQIAHVVMSIARTVDDIANNKATIAILKNRAGKSGKIFNNVEFNNGTCRISTDGVDEMDSLFEMKQKRDEERLRIQNEVFRSVQREHSNNS